ncbi:MAG: BadM/Rrf2 family transcriptional regulator [Dehalococcoidia bacterium]|nr:BadM/Rrf2 family transcriptional regulator [Dehalococcoidia bacterium]
MRISKSAQYALQSMLCLAAFDKLTSARRMAHELSLPANFLSKVLQQLHKRDLVDSTPGPRGGFVLARPSDEITLLEVFEAIDGIESGAECYLGLGTCDRVHRCPIHEECSAGTTRLKLVLAKSTLKSVLNENLSSSVVRRVKAVAKGR